MQSVLITIFFAFLFCSSAGAHVPGRGLTKISFQENKVSGEFSICSQDLATIASIEVDKNANLLASQQEEQIKFFLNKNLIIKFDNIPVAIKDFSIGLNRDICTYVTAKYSIDYAGTRPKMIGVQQDIFFDRMPSFSGLLAVSFGSKTKSTVLLNQQRDKVIYLDSRQEFVVFLKSGIQHIFGGVDHIFFILLLVFQAFILFQREDQTLKLAFTSVLINLFKLATVFTVAHSLTLCLTTINMSNPMSVIAEPMILISIIFVGFNNVFNFYRDRLLIVFCFGLFHGLGFASVLTNLGLSNLNLVIPLLGFNLGIEVGQVVIIAISSTSIALFLRRGVNSTKALIFASGVMSLIAGFWLVKRFLP